MYTDSMYALVCLFAGVIMSLSAWFSSLSVFLSVCGTYMFNTLSYPRDKIQNETTHSVFLSYIRTSHTQLNTRTQICLAWLFEIPYFNSYNEQSLVWYNAPASECPLRIGLIGNVIL